MKQKLLLLISISFFMFTGCEDILECVFNKRPEIPNATFKVGYVDTYYYEEFTSEVKNDPRDDNYGYNYEIYGELPDGLETFSNYRTLSIEGLPEVSGTFTFTVYLYVDPPLVYNEDIGEHEATMCSESTSRDFTIVIE